MVYGKKATPYFIALIQHSILGDYLTDEGIQLLWPATTRWYGTGITITSPTNILIEWTFFLTSLTIMLKAKDMWVLFQHHPSNLLLSIPILTALIPIFLSFPLPVPLELVIPHLTYLTIFTVSVLIDVKSSLK